MIRKSISTVFISASLLTLGACATTGTNEQAEAPMPKLRTEQYPMRAESDTRSISLRINTSGLSENQRRALDQVADQASWTRGAPVDVAIVTAPDPGAMSAGDAIRDYLMARDVSRDSLWQDNRQDQPADIVTVNVTYTHAVIDACNQSWENLSRTASNRAHSNFGCAVNSNLAAQIADPRDLQRAARPTSADAIRRSIVLDKYRKGEVTSSAKDDQANGQVSEAIK